VIGQLEETTHLCHGTSSDLIESALENGIQPRGLGDSNWKEFPSRPDMVYLSTAYPLYYAIAAAEKKEKPQNLDVVFFEVDLRSLKTKNMYPDEDFVAQAVAQLEKRPIEEIHNNIRENLGAYRKSWKRSLKHMGVCAHRGPIPPEAILRYARIDLRKNPYVFWAIDPVISLINYAICGKRYEKVTSWALGYEKEIPEVEEHGASSAHAEAAGQKEMADQFSKMHEEAKLVSKQRDGIEVVILREGK